MLTSVQLGEYEDRGYVFLPGCFSLAEARVMKLEFQRVMAKGNDGHQGGLDVVWAPHSKSGLFDALGRHPRLLGPSTELLGSEVYIYRFKLHTKIALTSELVNWHQDFKRWHDTDGMPSPRI